MSKIFLVGYMFAGKTTYGRVVAGRMGVRFVDLDEMIEERSGKSITEIFAEEGEECFRRREHEVLAEVCAEGGDMVVACGGGTACHEGNMEMMKRHGEVRYLRVPVEKIVERAREGRRDRPVLAGIGDEELAEFVARQVREREKYYLQADLVSDYQSVDEE